MKDDILVVEKKQYSRNRYAQESNNKLVVKLCLTVKSACLCKVCVSSRYLTGFSV